MKLNVGFKVFQDGRGCDIAEGVGSNRSEKYPIGLLMIPCSKNESQILLGEPGSDRWKETLPIEAVWRYQRHGPLSHGAH